jgi:hypothetical protein
MSGNAKDRDDEGEEVSSSAILEASEDGPRSRDLSAVLNLPDLSGSIDLPKFDAALEQGRKRQHQKDTGMRGMVRRHASAIQWGAAGVYLAVLIGVVVYFAIGLPDAARDSRAYVRAGQSMHVVDQLERYTKGPSATPKLQAARGYAFLYAKKPKDAARELVNAAKSAPASLEGADVSALMVLLGVPDEVSLDVEHALLALPNKPTAALEALYQSTHNALLRCRAAETLSKLGRSVPATSACTEALDTSDCAARKLAIRRVRERGEADAGPRLIQIARAAPLTFDDDCGQKEALETLATPR